MIFGVYVKKNSKYTSNDFRSKFMSPFRCTRVPRVKADNRKREPESIIILETRTLNFSRNRKCTMHKGAGVSILRYSVPNQFKGIIHKKHSLVKSYILGYDGVWSGVSILRCMNISILIKYSNFSGFYKKLGPFYKKTQM